LFAREVRMILNDKDGNIKVDGKLRRNHAYPTGIMDVISIEKTGEHFRILYDVAGRFILKSIKPDEAKFKLCRVKAKYLGDNKIPYLTTHDARTIRYPHPEISLNDTVKIELATGKIADFIK